MEFQTEQFYPDLKSFMESLSLEEINPERKLILSELADYVLYKRKQDQPVALNFICTHNSRRSILAQVWAKAWANYYGVLSIDTYSGGTEGTRVFPKIVDVLNQVGFQSKLIAEGNNPVWAIKFSPFLTPIIGFSKVYDDFYNPEKAFAAIMVCDDADENCPVVKGADKRFSIQYEDPKISDRTANQDEVYLERNRQVATEMKFVFSKLNMEYGNEEA
ncbi:MAG: protein-tyrosine-phosphatase [Saprospiraceae bacterium]